VNSGEGSLKKKVAYLHHGLMMNSEVWVCLTERERCLPFVLVEQGYDVWVCIRPPLPHVVSEADQ
jgi:lysosomal acid lipase/cholesteryl ester hydrolase